MPDSDRAYERLESYLEYRGFRPAPFRARPATELVIWPLCLRPGCRHPAIIVPFGAPQLPALGRDPRMLRGADIKVALLIEP